MNTDYEIRDGAGVLAALHRRRDAPDGSKSFLWLDPAGRPGLGGIASSSLPLYGAELVATYDPARPILVTEGEKAADAVRASGAQAVATVCGAGVIPDATSLAVLAHRDVILAPDHDRCRASPTWPRSRPASRGSPRRSAGSTPPGGPRRPTSPTCSPPAGARGSSTPSSSPRACSRSNPRCGPTCAPDSARRPRSGAATGERWGTWGTVVSTMGEHPDPRRGCEAGSTSTRRTGSPPTATASSCPRTCGPRPSMGPSAPSPRPSAGSTPSPARWPCSRPAWPPSARSAAGAAGAPGTRPPRTRACSSSWSVPPARARASRCASRAAGSRCSSATTRPWS